MAARRRRLTATPGVESDPYFSPDGSKVAFSATAAGNTDVYVMSVSGGDPKRLTYHPVIDQVRGWTPDGQRVLFSSVRAELRLSRTGVFGQSVLPAECRNRCNCPRAFTGSYSRDGQRMAYEEFSTTMFPPWQESELSGAIIGEAGPIRSRSIRSRRQFGRKAAVDKQQRQQSNVGRKYDLFHLRPQFHREPFFIEVGTKQVTTDHES